MDGKKRDEFKRELTGMINRYNIDGEGEIPDHVVAEMLTSVLEAYLITLFYVEPVRK